VHVGAAHVLRNYVMPHQLDLMRRSATVFVQTMREQQALAGLGVPHTAMRMLGMGVNPESAAGADGTRFRLAHGIAATTPLVLFMGSVTYDKGAVTLLAAMQRLWQHGSDAMAVIVGEAPKPGGFTAALAQVPAQWRDRIKRIDVLRGQDKHDAFEAADVFTLPSRVDSFGIVFLEAWLHGKPVIGADAGGIPEVITHGQDGFVLPFGDAEALAGHIHILIDNPERAAALGARGRENVLARHNWARIYRVVADATHAHARS
jgi:glycosyltransferase involved in cell wall biosynthesis